MKVVEGGFGKKEEKAKASEIVQSIADMLEEVETTENVDAKVVVMVQLPDYPPIITTNQSVEAGACLMDIAKENLLNAYWNTECVTEPEEDHNEPLH